MINGKVVSINPFSTNIKLLYPLKTSEKLWLSDAFRGDRSEILVNESPITVNK